MALRINVKGITQYENSSQEVPLKLKNSLIEKYYLLVLWLPGLIQWLITSLYPHPRLFILRVSME